MKGLTKIAMFALSGGALLQFGGCLQNIWNASLNALLNNLLTQFLPLGVQVVQGGLFT